MRMPTVAPPQFEGSALAAGSYLNRNPLLKYLWKYRYYYLVSLVATLVAAVISLLATTYLVEQAINHIREEKGASGLTNFALLILGAGLLQSVFGWSGRWFGSTASRQIEYYLRADLARHFLSLDESFFLKSRTGDLMSRAMNDLQAIRDMVGPIASAMGRMIIVAIVGFAVLITMNFKLAVLSLIYLPIVGIVIGFFEVKVERRFTAVQEQLSTLTDVSQESMSGIAAVKAYAREESEIEAFAEQNEEMRQRAMGLATYQSALWPVFVVLGVGATLTALFFGAPAVVDGSLTPGQLVRFILVLGIISWDLMMIGWVISILQLGFVANRRINELFRRSAEIVDGPSTVSRTPKSGHIEFKNVSVQFEEHTVLRDLSFEIEVGKTVALAGKTGAGKTTLLNLLPRLVDVSAGEVFIDGINAKDYQLESLRNLIGFVPQEAYLFSDSIQNNLKYGNDDADPQEIDAALRVSRLSNDLEQLDGAIDTLIGERGASLSGGQKQRAALARAILKDAPILVLDDALSHVDTHTEEEILGELEQYMNGRTTLLVAHRTSTLRTADEILMLQDGEITEKGSHSELVEKGGAYSELYREQLLIEARGPDLDNIEIAD